MHSSTATSCQRLGITPSCGSPEHTQKHSLIGNLPSVVSYSVRAMGGGCRKTGDMPTFGDASMQQRFGDRALQLLVRKAESLSCTYAMQFNMCTSTAGGRPCVGR